MSAGFARKRPPGPVLSHDQFSRQGRAVRAATAALADNGAVRAFLNSHHEGLRGRPLDLAIASDAGLLAVETAIGEAAEPSLRTGKERLMFGFQGGESAETVARKRLYMKDARQRWPFLTYFDASTIRNELQLISIVKDRSGRPRSEAEADVQAWTSGKLFQ